ncbi:hypothetical protein [Lysinibacillus sp. NPDC096212]|uniref:hypothetical protein n=1 Tax=Lysinibacillus sp. NPDC096212 TaxID=3364135 RepID=UPI003811F34A
MEKFCEKLNEDTESNRYQKWHEHRNAISNLFNEVFSVKGYVQKIGILGAGNCDDLDINFLSSKCDEIILFDIDLSSMEKAVAKLSEEVKKKITLVKVDLTNLNKFDFYNKFEEMVKENVPSKKIKRFLVESASKLKMDNENLESYYYSCDIVASSAIYTQLVLNWLQEKSKNSGNYTTKELDEIVNDGGRYLTDSVVKQYNSELLKLVRKDGNLVVWADILPVHPGEYDYFRKRNYSIDKRILNQHGLTFSFQGLKDIRDRANFNKWSNWIWDFSSNGGYICIGSSANLL